MSQFFSFLAIYFVVWFLVLFLALPFGVERNEQPEVGHDIGAPKAPRMWWKALAATIMSAIVTTLIWVGFSNGWINLHP